MSRPLISVNGTSPENHLPTHTRRMGREAKQTSPFIYHFPRLTKIAPENELHLCVALIFLSPLLVQKQRWLTRMSFFLLLFVWFFFNFITFYVTRLTHRRYWSVLCCLCSHKIWFFPVNEKQLSFWNICCILSFLSNMILRCFSVYFIMLGISKLYLLSYILDKNCPVQFSVFLFMALICCLYL